MIKAAIFDYGETLVSPKVRDEEIVPRALLATYRFLVQTGLSIPYDEFVRAEMSIFRKYGQLEAEENRDIPDVIKYVELLGELFPDRSSAWVRRTATRADAVFWGVVAGHYSTSRGARRSLRELKSMSLKLAVLSNHHSHRALVGHLRQLELDGYFVRIFSSAQLGVRKPDPRAFERCLSVIKVRSGDAIFVGDSVKYDIAGAKACGMKTILLETGRRRAHPGEQSGKEAKPREATPDFTISALSQVPSIVKQLNKRRHS